jgi:hypothetical protein
VNGSRICCKTYKIGGTAETSICFFAIISTGRSGSAWRWDF